MLQRCLAPSSRQRRRPAFSRSFSSRPSASTITSRRRYALSSTSSSTPVSRYTILRPNFFMENFSQGSFSGTIKNQNGIFVAAGHGKTSFISVRDIASAVVAALGTPLLGREFDLTGPEALDYAEVAKVITAMWGHPIEYHSITEDQMTAGLRAHGMPDSAVAYLATLYSVVRAGYAAGITSDVETITGRRPTDFKTFAQVAFAEWNVGVSCNREITLRA